MALATAAACGLFAQGFSPEAFAAQGVRHLRAGKTVDAIAAFRNAVAQRPASADLRFLLGLALYQAGQPELAREELGRVLAAQPSHAKALHLDGLCLLKQGKLREGAEALEEVLRKDPGNGAAALTLATTRVSLGELAQAERLLPGPLARAPQAPRKLVVGMILNAQSRYREAEKVLRQAARLDPKLPMVHSQLGYTLMLLGDYPRAIQEFESELRLSPEDFHASANLGWILVQERRFEAAAPLLENAFRQQPASAGLHYLLAQVWWSRRDDARAQELLERAVALKPEFRAAHVLLARVYTRQNRKEEAARQQAIVAKLTEAEQENNLGVPEPYGGSVPPPELPKAGVRP